MSKFKKQWEELSECLDIAADITEPSDEEEQGRMQLALVPAGGYKGQRYPEAAGRQSPAPPKKERGARGRVTPPREASQASGRYERSRGRAPLPEAKDMGGRFGESRGR